MEPGSLVSGGQLVPGQILIRNKYLRQDEDSRFVRLRDEDTGLEFKCRVEFSDSSWEGSPPLNYSGNVNPIPLFFGLAKDSPKLFFPTVSSMCEDYAFLLQPPIANGIFPGGATPNLTISPSNDSSWKAISLRKLEPFYDETLVSDGNGQYHERNKYEMIVHHSEGIHPFQLERPCLAFVYKLERHFRGFIQGYKHVDASLLGFYEDSRVVRENLSQLDSLKTRYNMNWKLNAKCEREYWFDNFDQLPANLFESLTHMVDKRTSSADNSHKTSFPSSDGNRRTLSSKSSSTRVNPLSLSAYGIRHPHKSPK